MASENNKRIKKKRSKTSIIAAIAVLLAVIITAGMKIRGNMLQERVYSKIKQAVDLKETKPILSSSMYSGKIAYAYQLASEIPEIVDKQFCYCYCRKNHGHKTLLTCFTSDHGAKCNICMNEVFMSYDLLRKGWNLDKITAQIDDVFSKIAKRHGNFAK